MQPEARSKCADRSSRSSARPRSAMLHQVDAAARASPSPRPTARRSGRSAGRSRSARSRRSARRPADGARRTLAREPPVARARRRPGAAAADRPSTVAGADRLAAATAEVAAPRRPRQVRRTCRRCASAACSRSTATQIPPTKRPGDSRPSGSNCRFTRRIRSRRPRPGPSGRRSALASSGALEHDRRAVGWRDRALEARRAAPARADARQRRRTCTPLQADGATDAPAAERCRAPAGRAAGTWAIRTTRPSRGPLTDRVGNLVRHLGRRTPARTSCAACASTRLRIASKHDDQRSGPAAGPVELDGGRRERARATRSASRRGLVGVGHVAHDDAASHRGQRVQPEGRVGDHARAAERAGVQLAEVVAGDVLHDLAAGLGDASRRRSTTVTPISRSRARPVAQPARARRVGRDDARRASPRRPAGRARASGRAPARRSCRCVEPYARLGDHDQVACGVLDDPVQAGGLQDQVAASAGGGAPAELRARRRRAPPSARCRPPRRSSSATSAASRGADDVARDHAGDRSRGRSGAARGLDRRSCSEHVSASASRLQRGARRCADRAAHRTGAASGTPCRGCRGRRGRTRSARAASCRGRRR